MERASAGRGRSLTACAALTAPQAQAAPTQDVITPATKFSADPHSKAARGPGAAAAGRRGSLQRRLRPERAPHPPRPTTTPGTAVGWRE
ncbi:hypothetical protein CD934_04955 [Streptomyces calvus]|uniref:Uncharacterized protein n=1 Tax=Streptomyces calvus TaxID=67282 RepID=A0A514JL96_9ACTN|nr:hypothetical protein CD934_04955 [Streptomyces calvus]